MGSSKALSELKSALQKSWIHCGESGLHKGMDEPVAEMWSKLPEELLVRLLSKLTFHNLVTLRRVCKYWKKTVIPLAGKFSDPPAIGSGGSALVYYGPREFEQPHASCWLHACDSKGRWHPPRKEFLSESFPVCTTGGTFSIAASEGGLLFFSLEDGSSGQVKEFVVINPLTGQSKTLPMPPSSIWSRGSGYHNRHVSVGVEVSRAGSYKLLVVGMDAEYREKTLLFDSVTSAWKVAAPVPDGSETVRIVSGRSVSCKGCLYWTFPVGKPVYDVIKYDLEKNAWSRFGLDDGFNCPASVPASFGSSHIGWHKGNVLLSHLHQPMYDPNYYDALTSRCAMWQSESLAASSEMDTMSRSMVDQIEEFLTIPVQCRELPNDCASFGQRHFFYSVMLSSRTTHDGGRRARIQHKMFLRTMVHNTHDDSCVQLQPIEHHRIMSADNLWAFFPSLVAVP